MPAALVDIEGIKKDRSKFTLELEDTLTGWKTDKANIITFFIPVTAMPNYSGDVKLNIKGGKAGIEDTDIVVGKVIAPITVETTVTKVINGAQKQALADITIKENIAGYLDDTVAGDKNRLALNFDTLGLTNGFSVDDAKVEVTDGNLEVDSKVTLSNKQGKDDHYDKAVAAAIVLKIKESSTKPSTIKVSGVSASLSRLLPEGGYNLEVYGPALENNIKYNDEAFDVPTVKTPYVHIATAADTDQKAVNSTFVIGSTTYTVDGKENTMDVAPFIDGNNRTMAPIRFVANALGINDQDITYSLDRKSVV